MSKQASKKIKHNGRSTYQELKDKFDKVVLKYTDNEDGTTRTTAVLVEEESNTVHVGVAKHSNRTFNFSKTKGRNMALGRAELAANVYHGVEGYREDTAKKRREDLSYSVDADSDEDVSDIINSIVYFSPRIKQ